MPESLEVGFRRMIGMYSVVSSSNSRAALSPEGQSSDGSWIHGCW